MKETNHSYDCLCGNWHDSSMNHTFKSWDDFKNTWLGFNKNRDGTFGEYDDDYHFLFRYDIKKYEGKEAYFLQLCHMLQRKGIYCFHYVENITQEELDNEIRLWLLDRKKYILSLWDVE